MKTKTKNAWNFLSYLPITYRFTVDSGRTVDLLNRFSSSEIEISAESETEFSARGINASKAEWMMQNEGIAYRKEPENRFLRSVFSVFSARGVIIGCVVSLLFFAILSLFVADIRVVGEGDFSEKEVLTEAEEAGVAVGALWRSIDFDAAERSILLKSREVGWVNITRKGAVAIVAVKPKQVGDLRREPAAVRNIVASEDAVIEEITVISGVAAVKPGDVVKKGDLLISGVLPSAIGGGTAPAEGTVIGRASHRLEAFSARETVGRAYSKGKTAKISVKVFGKALNIFKISRKAPTDCVIIKEIHIPSVGERAPLPLEIERELEVPFVDQPMKRTEEEMRKAASLALKNQLISRFSASDVLSVAAYGEMKDDGFLLTGEVIASEDIGTYQTIETD